MAKAVKKEQEKLTPEQLIGQLFHGKAFSSEVKAVEDNERTLLVKISSVNPDRSNDIVEPQGCDLTNYMKNPVVLLSHNYQSLPIAKCIDIQIMTDSIVAKVQFPDAGIYEVSDVVYTMCKEGYLNGWSIGFIPTEYTERKDDNGWGYTFTKWQLLEFSAVAVPDNQDALTIMRSKGINVDVLEHEQKLEDAEAALKTLEKVEEKTTVTDVSPVEKTGRAVSKKNEDLIKSAIDMLNQVLADLEEDDADNGADEAEEDKTIETTETVVKTEAEEKTTEKTIETGIENADDSLLYRLSKSLKKTDKEVGLTLRLLKSLEATRGGEK